MYTSVYSLPSYKAVKFHPTGELFIADKAYLHLSSTFPPFSTSYTKLLDISTMKTLRFYNDKDHKISIGDTKVSWMTKVSIPYKLISNYPKGNIIEDKAKQCGLRAKEILYLIHWYNDEWVLARTKSGTYSNYHKSYIELKKQLELCL